jgi:hypothetical protein
VAAVPVALKSIHNVQDLGRRRLVPRCHLAEPYSPLRLSCGRLRSTGREEGRSTGLCANLTARSASCRLASSLQATDGPANRLDGRGGRSSNHARYDAQRYVTIRTSSKCTRSSGVPTALLVLRSTGTTVTVIVSAPIIACRTAPVAITTLRVGVSGCAGRGS